MGGNRPHRDGSHSLKHNSVPPQEVRGGQTPWDRLGCDTEDPFHRFEWAYVLPKRSFPCPLTQHPSVQRKMLQVSTVKLCFCPCWRQRGKQQLCNQSECIWCLIYSCVKHDFGEIWFGCICKIKVMWCNQCAETCREKNNLEMKKTPEDLMTLSKSTILHFMTRQE